jgi:(p)ppGpp synthase/HD superfamily hydrolase
VEIETKENVQPNKKWSDTVRTTMARKHIQQYYLRQQKESAAEQD